MARSLFSRHSVHILTSLLLSVVCRYPVLWQRLRSTHIVRQLHQQRILFLSQQRQPQIRQCVCVKTVSQVQGLDRALWRRLTVLDGKAYRHDAFSSTSCSTPTIPLPSLLSVRHVATRCCSIETQKRRLEAEERRRSDTEHSQPRNQRLEVDGHSPSIVHPLHFRLPMVREVRYAVDFPQCTPKV